MKKNRFFWASAAIAALTLTACADQDEFNQNDVQTAAVENAPGAIQFGTYLGENGTTRAWGTTSSDYQKGIITTTGTNETESLHKAEFGVFAYQSTTNWSANSLAAEFMYNQKISWGKNASNVDMWVYDPVKFWPNGLDAANGDNDPSNSAIQDNTYAKMLNFFAYAPYTANTTTAYTAANYGAYPVGLANTDVFQTAAHATATSKGGIVGMTDWDSTKDPWVNYYLHNPLTTEAVDLLWGLRGQYTYDETDNVDNMQVEKLGNSYNVNLTKQSVDEKVRFLFKHALAKLAGSTKNESESDVTKPAQSGLKIVLDVDANTTDPGLGADNQGSYFPAGFDATKTLVTVNSIKIQDANTFYKENTSLFTEAQESNVNTYGWFNISTGQWENGSHPSGTPETGDGTKVNLVISDGADPHAELNAIIKEIGVYTSTETPATPDDSKKSLVYADKKTWDQTKNPTGVKTGTPIPVYSNENQAGIVLIPGDAPQTFYITVDYFVRTADTQLKNGWSQVQQIITNKVDLTNLEPNKYYTLIIHLGLTSVKFEAVVVDWTQNPDDTYDEDGNVNENPTTADKDIIWLPSNVVNTTSITADANTKHKAVTVAADKTSYTIHLTGLTDGNKLSWDAVSPNVAASASPVTITGTEADVVLTLTPNNTAQAVEHTVVINEKNSSDVIVSSTTVKLTQAAGKLTLTRSTDDLIPETGQAGVTVTATNGTANVALTPSPAEVTITENDPYSYITSPTASVTTNVATFDIPKNTSPYKVTYTVSATNGVTSPLTATTTFVQAAGTQVPTIIRGGTETTISSDDTEDDVLTYNAYSTGTTELTSAAPTYKVTINGTDRIADYKFSTASTWLTVDHNSGALTFTSNPSRVERTATIVLTHTGGAKTYVTVKQKGK